MQENLKELQENAEKALSSHKHNTKNIEKIKKTLWLHTLPAEEENTLEEFAWAFGEDTVNEIEKRVHQVISHLHHWPELEAISESGLARQMRAWHNLGVIDEDVESSEKVEELYQKLGKQLKSLAGLLEENGQSSSNAFQAVTNLSRNVDFLQQINQTYAYIQLPLHLRQGEHKTGELFVYTNKKNLAGRDGRVSALLHLDMEHLGPLDVYVALQDTKVSTKFYVQNDTILDYLEANMEVLTQRLKQRGYVCNCETTLRTELQQTAQAMAPILKAGGSVPVAQYAFDVRT